ncbi:hypothetical protein NMY3_03038 [Candidatus Nitrosocosmicus oleophilus]|uniref:Uncharacterized protein n=1 Tax=Candidatus Nitrosocosmicus oleophilus TaxID=1353260 RepID=A0A654M186_9ARCH|nr:hypothetical protein NMY3_03038 [Candidatus Nitrosocosmicus oleophilus]
MKVKVVKVVKALEETIVERIGCCNLQIMLIAILIYSLETNVDYVGVVFLNTTCSCGLEKRSLSVGTSLESLSKTMKFVRCKE